MNTMNDAFRAILFWKDGTATEKTPHTEQKNGLTVVTLPKAELAQRPCEKVEIRTNLTCVPAGTKGCMFYPVNASAGIAATYFAQPREEGRCASTISAMPFGGITECDQAIFFHVTGMDSVASINAVYENGMYELYPAFHLEGDEPDEDIVVRYKPMPGATYADMARYYRQYQLDEKGCVPLCERVKTNETLHQAAEGIELRIRMGWKPSPSDVWHQTPENEPPMKVACDIKTIDALLDKLHEKGVKNVEICLVGWGEGGHDGRFPQQLPSDPRYGGDEALKKLIAKAQSMGYLMTCHVVTTAAFEIADNWDEKQLGYWINPETGKMEPLLRNTYRTSGLSGGLPYSLCAKTSYEHYVKKDFPKIRDLGFKGLFYDDVLTLIMPDKCCHPDHPVSRKQAQDYYRKVAQLSRELFGGFQSEGWFDFMNSDVDYVLYTSFKTRLTRDMNPLFDEGIPFWQLVYHGIVMSNATSETVNYPIKPEREHLRALEWGARPLMFVYSKFGPKKNWMGDLDLETDTPEKLEKTAEAVRKASEEYEQLKRLQYVFMDNHEKLAEGVYRTTYSDGTTVTVDYNRDSFEISAPEKA